jgi:hypothetical protein
VAGFNAAGIGVQGRSTNGRGVDGYSANARGVYGQSDGLGGAGIEGFADANSGVAGVYGRSNKGVGVWGVNTSASGIAMFSQGNAIQSPDKGGWIKAMALIDTDALILRCYNGQTGAGQSSPFTADHCGFTATRLAKGYYQVDFGFPVSDRFLSISPGGGIGIGASAYFIENHAEVFSFRTDTGNLVDGQFYIVVY